MREIWQVFLNAVMFFTRIPVPAIYSVERLNRASVFFPLVGWIVAGIAALTYVAASKVLGHQLAIWLSMGATIWATGAFHEDGWADFCDGFGGGYTQERILEIMKDSRIGTYGTVGLILMLGAKAMALTAIPETYVVPVLLVGHAASRSASASLIYFGTYVTADLRSKAKPLATRMSLGGLLTACFFGVLPLVALPLHTWWLLLLVVLVTWRMYAYTNRWIGGYTGDCLGAVQQLTELVIYLSIVALLPL